MDRLRVALGEANAILCAKRTEIASKARGSVYGKTQGWGSWRSTFAYPKNVHSRVR
jgi:hypothetical protein